MPSEPITTRERVETLATKLDGLDTLDGEDKETLAAVFALAGRAARPVDDEVVGYRKAGERPHEYLPLGHLVLQGAFTHGFEYG